MVAKYGYFVIGTACVVLGTYGSVRRILRVRRVRKNQRPPEIFLIGR